MDTTRAAYDEVYVYTMARPGFILQHVVDAFAVQTADETTKPIAVVFGLVGLYLHIEKQCSGRHVQEVHRKLARARRSWPRVQLPEARGSMTVADVLAARSRTGHRYRRLVSVRVDRIRRQSRDDRRSMRSAVTPRRPKRP